MLRTTEQNGFVIQSNTTRCYMSHRRSLNERAGTALPFPPKEGHLSSCHNRACFSSFALAQVTALDSLPNTSYSEDYLEF